MENEELTNPINPDKIAQNPGLLPYAHIISGPVIRPEDMGKVKVKALAAMEEQTNLQLRQIHEQIELLAKQASEIKRRVEVSYTIYNAQMGFEPIVGHTYYLYKNKDSKHFLSIIAPDEWGNIKGFGEFVCKVKMLGDHTWQVIG